MKYKSPKVRRHYHTGTEHLLPSKLKAPAGKRAFSMAPPDDIDKPKPVTRPVARYSNRSVIDEVLGETG